VIESSEVDDELPPLSEEFPEMEVPGPERVRAAVWATGAK
jgi:hypothetical protein